MVTLANRAKVATATNGTGTITLGTAESGYQTFADAGVEFYSSVRYVIEDGDAWEIGTGIHEPIVFIGGQIIGASLTRTVIESSTGSLLSLSGQAVVYISAVSQDIVQPSDLATVATTGAYSDLTGIPAENTWGYLYRRWSVEPTLIATIGAGEVYEYTLYGVTRYRFVPEPYDAAQDAFYNDLALTDLIVARG